MKEPASSPSVTFTPTVNSLEYDDTSADFTLALSGVNYRNLSFIDLGSNNLDTGGIT